MKEITDETFTEIARIEKNGSHHNYNHLREILYFSEKEGYFLAGEGGCSTKYQQYLEKGQVTGSAEYKTKLTLEQALKWLDDNNKEKEKKELKKILDSH